MTVISIFEEALYKDSEKVVFVDIIVEKVTEKLRENNNNHLPRQNITQMHTNHVQKKLLQTKLLQTMLREKWSVDSRIIEIVVTETDIDVEIIMLNGS